MKKRAASAGVQLFSFLDAMICTMGALLVLLHAFARHGQIEVDQKAKAPVHVAGEADPVAEREVLEWRTVQLKESRAKTEEQLAEERLKLSHVEDHQRRLRDKFKQLQIAAAELEKLDATKSQQREQDAAQLAEIRSQLHAARQAVKNARRRGQEQASYSVVPYEGPNSTHRRPIYIECRANQIVLQPEGIELAPEDFAGFLGPGNPLASALRGIREYYARQAGSVKDKGEPYPLMLVRPDGIEAYYAARTALDSWGSEFGYELVGADWQLTFPEPDPKLAELTRQMVADARMRTRELIATSPQFARRSRTTLHASPHGGFVAAHGSGGTSGGNDGRGAGRSIPGGWDTLGTDWVRRGKGVGGDSTGDGLAQGDGSAANGGNAEGTSLTGSGNGYGTGMGQSGAPGRYANGGYGTDSNGTGRYAKAGGGGPGGDMAGGTGSETSEGQAGTAGGPSKAGESANGSAQGQPVGPNASGQTSNGQYAAGQSGGQAGSGQSGSKAESDSKSGGQASGTLGGKFGGQTGDSAAGSSSAASSSGSSASSGSSTSSGSSGSGGSSDSASGASAMMQVPSKKTTPLSKSRGRDWGLPDGGVGATSATRAILIECHNDRLVIVPEERNQSPKSVRMGEQAQETIDEFVSDVWQHMKGWGTAGKGLYWRPELVMDVQPGAADRYAEVKSLLADSGLDVRARQPRATAQPPARKPNRR